MPHFSSSLALLGSAAVLVVACGGPQFSEAGFRQRLDRLIGQPKEALVAELGKPYREYPLRSGNVFISFTQSWGDTVGGYYNSTPQTEYVDGYIGGRHYSETRTTYIDNWVPTESVLRKCDVDFEMSPQGLAVKYQYWGDGCSAMEKKI